MTRSTRYIWSLVAAFLAGVAVDSWLRVYGPPKPRVAVEPVIAPAPVVSDQPRVRPSVVTPLAPLSAASPAAPIATTGTKPSRLRVPIDGMDVDSMKGGFAERRSGHTHEAVDVLAPRNTPIHAVEDGEIAKLFVSKAGGNTIYQFDPSQKLVYYYAHLERYATGIAEGQQIKKGQIIGYVGTSGNAPPNTPHLHFAVFELGADRRWWQGRPLDPYLVFRGKS